MFHYIHIPPFVYLSVDGFWGHFYFFAIMNKIAIRFVYKTFCEHVFLVLLGRYLGRKLLENMMILFNILRNRQTVFHSDCIALHFHQQQMKVPVSSHPCQHSLLSVTLIIAILLSMNWQLIVIVSYISLMTNDFAHLFMNLLIICISSLEKCLLSSFANF